MPKHNRITKAEGLASVAADLCDEYNIEPNPIHKLGTKWKHRLGIDRMGLSAGVAGFMNCVIEYADEATGIAWPSAETIAAWSCLSLSCVEKSASKAEKLKFVTITHRSMGLVKRGNIYLINWEPFLDAFNRPRPARTMYGLPPVQCATHRPYNVQGITLIGTTLKDTTVVHPPSAAGTTPKIVSSLKEKKEGLQRREEVGFPPTPYAEAKTSIVSGLNQFARDWLSAEGLEAATDAELKESGSGHAVAASHTYLGCNLERSQNEERGLFPGHPFCCRSLLARRGSIPRPSHLAGFPRRDGFGAGSCVATASRTVASSTAP
jgi:hypothetical protein